jgi:transcription termination factor Rho
MLEISELKTQKLPELQELAKALKVPKFKSLKKLDLVYQILDYQAANPKVLQAFVAKETPSQKKDETPSIKKEETASEKKEETAVEKQEAPKSTQVSCCLRIGD